jgi:hypothetical protein
MAQMPSTGHHAVVVRNGAGQVVHTHEVIDFEDAAPLSEEELLEQAVSAARRAHATGGEDFRAVLVTRAELEASRTETMRLRRS